MTWEKLSSELKFSDLAFKDRPLLFRNVIKNPETFLSWKNIEECFDDPQNYGFEVIDRETGKKHHIPKTPSPINGRPVPTKEFLTDSLNNGHSMAIRGGYSTHNSIMNSFAAEIEEMFNMATQIDIYLSGTTSRSFPIHEDTSTNFICQMFGNTRWKVFKNRCSDLLRLKEYPFKEDELDVCLDEVLTPGDVLYIPSRNFHVAIPTERRLSLSIVCLPQHYPHRAQRIDRTKLQFKK